MPAVLDGVIVLVAWSVENFPTAGVVVPIELLLIVTAPIVPPEMVAVGIVTVPVNVGEASGAAPRLVSAADAVAAFVPPFAIGTRPVNAAAETFAHAGAVLAPVDTIACPLVEPAGLRS
jgi:hypothetical protein